MFRKYLAFLALLPVLAGCGGDEPPAASSVIPVSYSITANAAGPITADTPYSAATFHKLFPNERIDVVATADEDGVVNAMTVFSDGLQVMMVIPASGGKTIKAVHGSGLAVAGPNGERLGMTFKQSGMSRNDCQVGTGPWLGMAVCNARGAPNVALVFDNGGWNGSPNELAPAASLAEGKLQRIVWLPPRTG
jgi:Protein of unknown function (DUF1131)